MPQVRKLAPEEVKAISNKGKGSRKLVEEEYDGILATFEAGDYGEVSLGEEDNRLTVRNRLKAAAKRRGVDVTFLRSKGDAMRFKVEENGNGAATAQVEAPPAPDTEAPPAGVDIPPEVEEAPVGTDAPPKRRGGRPRKNPQA